MSPLDDVMELVSVEAHRQKRKVDQLDCLLPDHVGCRSTACRARRSHQQPSGPFFDGHSSAIEPSNQLLAVGVENDCEYDHQTNYDRLEIVADPLELKARAQNLQDAGTRQGADDRTLATVEARAAYYNCGNSV